MLAIYLRIDQYHRLYYLTRLFPDLCFVFKDDYSYEYHGTLKEGPEGMEQLAYLHECGIGYIDLEDRLERLARAFFQKVQVEGEPIERLEVQLVVGKRETYTVTLRTARQAVQLTFPSDWNPPTEDVAHQYDEWLCICKAQGEIRAALASRGGNERALCHRTETMSEMEAWLKTRHMLPVLRLPPAIGIFALYKPLKKTQ